MFSPEQDAILKELLLHIPSLNVPKNTPFKKHSLPDALKNQLYQILKQEHPEWSISQLETERYWDINIRRIARLNREQYVLPMQRTETRKVLFVDCSRITS
jgi:hypothetical protein